MQYKDINTADIIRYKGMFSLYSGVVCDVFTDDEQSLQIAIMWLDDGRFASWSIVNKAEKLNNDFSVIKYEEI